MDYDPVKLGFVVNTSCSSPDCLGDPSETGDGNGGHLRGTNPSMASCMASICALMTFSTAVIEALILAPSVSLILQVSL